MLYHIIDIRNGQKVAELEFEANGPPILHCTQPQARAELQRLVGRDLLTVDDPDEFGDPVEEGAMCYLGQRTITPTDPAYLQVLTRQLPLLTHYELRPLAGE
ncbi:MAG: hypothetical protein JWP00_1828 [Chloroflexi bacterium]|jgi:hypothetical protein|nr:hypothetical protein [Chloroflexota bacterium]